MATYQLDTIHSSIGFSVRHMVVARTRGQFHKWSAELELDDEDLARSTVRVSIDTASIDTQNEQRDAHLRSADFLDVEKHPALTFVSRRVEKAKGDRYELAGDLTIRGVTREVTLDVEFGGRARDPWGNDRAGFHAKASIDRKDFGLVWNQILETGGLLVGDKIEITIDLEAIRAVNKQAA